MSRKASTIRAKQGLYVPFKETRTKPTTGNLGPRDAGPHGKTVRREPNYGSQNWFESLIKGMRGVRKSDHANPRNDRVVVLKEEQA